VAEPRFSILTPVYDTPAGVLSEMLESVRRQTFEDWELCLVDDASPEAHVLEMLEAAQRQDPRIRVVRRAANGGIVAASNDALAMASGEFAALLDHDDELHPEALAAVDEALRADPDADYAYTDEDKIDQSGRHTGAFFKPDWSPDRLRTQMYTCHFSVLRRSLVEEVGGFDPEFEGSQDWDLILRVTERARAVVHVPRILYHWRMLKTSAAGGGESAKPWAFDAGRRAVQAHCERIGLQARVERDDRHAGVYHLAPVLVDRPPVSIVIPTNGQAREVRYRQEALVSHCVRSIVGSSTYDNYEIVVVADPSTPTAVRDELKETGADRLRLVEYDQPFNFSAKINLGAAHSEGEHLLLLNDDIEVATPAWIERMAMYSMLEEVGAVGGRLLWEDGRLQHVGVRFEGGLPGHPYRGFAGGFKGYGNEVLVARDALAVTGACLMTRRELFDEAGGLSTELPVNYNDIDYCLRLREGGRRAIYDPDLTMFHFESSSRSGEVEEWEKEYLLERWLPVTSPDPYSNPNLREGFPTVGSRLLVSMSRHPRIAHRLARWRDAGLRLTSG
jgi:GT2 family glycosyltransferase